MFGWFKKAAPSAPALPEAATDYLEQAVKQADTMFAKAWAFDPAWIGVLSVAAEIDNICGNQEKMNAVVSAVSGAFTEGKDVKVAASLLLIQHMSNQRELENMRRQQMRS